MKITNPIKKKKLLEIIVAEFKKIDKAIPTINQGGCGCFAYEAYKLLVALGLNVKLGVITYNKHRTAYHLKNNSGARETPFSHIVLCVGRKLIDSGGIYDKPNQIKEYEVGYDIAKGMSVELLRSWLDENGWNRKFNRERYLPVIEQKIKNIQKNLVASI